jgi:hypothetical protein
MSRDMKRLRRRAVYVIALGSIGVISVSTFVLSTRASANQDPFQGISAAERAPAATPPAQALAQIQDGSGAALGGAVISGTRLLASTIDGHPAYVVPTEAGDFCLFIATLGSACASPFTDARPAFLVVAYPNQGSATGPIVFGLAEDGVNSLTFSLDGTEHTAPVHQNVFEYTGTPSANSGGIADVTANFMNGQAVKMEQP